MWATRCVTSLRAWALGNWSRELVQFDFDFDFAFDFDFDFEFIFDFDFDFNFVFSFSFSFFFSVLCVNASLYYHGSRSHTPEGDAL